MNTTGTEELLASGDLSKWLENTTFKNFKNKIWKLIWNSNSESASNFAYIWKMVLKKLFSTLIWTILSNKKIILGRREKIIENCHPWFVIEVNYTGLVPLRMASLHIAQEIGLLEAAQLGGLDYWSEKLHYITWAPCIGSALAKGLFI